MIKIMYILLSLPHIKMVKTLPYLECYRGVMAAFYCQTYDSGRMDLIDESMAHAIINNN